MVENKTYSSTSILTYSGVYLDLVVLDPDTILIEDLAHGTAFECRFGNQLKVFYSVAQHSVLMSLLPGSLEEKYERLMHDTSEGILLDMPKPIKNLLPDYQALEDRVQGAICKKFNVPFPFSESLHKVDYELFLWEQAGLVYGEHKIDCWTPQYAEERFLKRFYELTDQLKQEENDSDRN